MTVSQPFTLRLPRTLTALCCALLSSAVATAAPLSKSTPAHIAPDSSAAVLRILPAGSETTAAPSGTRTPDGWSPISIAGPFELYVRNGDIDKGLQIKPGSSLYQQPDAESPLLAHAEEGDRITITGLHGRWTQVELDKALVAYIQNGAQSTARVDAQPSAAGSSAPAVASPTATQPAASAPESQAPVAAPEGPAPEPEAVAVIDMPPGGQVRSSSPPSVPLATVRASTPASAGPLISQASSGQATLRELKGKLVSTKRLFGSKRPYDWQLSTRSGLRIGYLDFSKMQDKQQIEPYAGRQVIVLGVPELMADGENYRIEVVSIRYQ